MKVVNAITYLREFNTDGHKPILILADDNNKYVVKPCRTQPFDYSIYNEIFCHHLLKLWDIPTPEISLVKIDKEITVNSDNASSYKKTAYSTYFFGSLFHEKAIELNSYLSFNKKLDYKKLVSPEKLIELGLFDIWVENDDRKPSNFNILIHPNKDRFHFLAIDNAFTFSTMSYSNLNPEYVSNSFNDNILYSPLTKGILKKVKPNQKWVAHQKDLFYLCIERCNNQFDEITQNISSFYALDSVDCSSLKKFLFSDQRNKMVFQEFVSRIK